MKRFPSKSRELASSQERPPAVETWDTVCSSILLIVPRCHCQPPPQGSSHFLSLFASTGTERGGATEREGERAEQCEGSGERVEKVACGRWGQYAVAKGKCGKGALAGVASSFSGVVCVDPPMEGVEKLVG